MLNKSCYYSPWRIAVGLIVVLLLPKTPSTVIGFAPRLTTPPRTSHSRRHNTRINGTIEFQGESTTSIEIPFPSSNMHDNKKSLSTWMLSHELSDPFFLGSSNYQKRSDGSYDAFQPTVDWFGLELMPIFVIQVKRDGEEQTVAAMIKEARNEIVGKNKDSVTGRLVARVMGGSTFQGGNTVHWSESESKDGWIVQADLSLTLSIQLPRYLPLPPGFNAIGSRIVKSTCKSRLKKFVVHLQEAYLEWAEEKEGIHQ